MKIIRTVFQDSEVKDRPRQFILVLDMEDSANFSTASIPDLISKMETALPGIFPSEGSRLAHECGGIRSGKPIHPFRDEVKQGTDIPHLLEHIILYLLSRRTKSCSAFCGQRSIDISQGITTHYYLVLECPSKIEAIIASDIGFQLVKAWIEGRTVTIDPLTILQSISVRIKPMLGYNIYPTPQETI